MAVPGGSTDWWFEPSAVGPASFQQSAASPGAGWRGPFPTEAAARKALAALTGGGGGSGGGGPGGGGGGAQDGAGFVASAKTFIGDASGAGPAALDCSHLVQEALQRVGVRGVPRTSEAQWAWVRKITQAQLQPGDLIFEQWPGDNSPPGHVVIYAGGGQVIEAPGSGGTFVHERSWSPSETTIVGYGRVPSWAGFTGGLGGGGLGGGISGGGGGIWDSITSWFGDAGSAAASAGHVWSDLETMLTAAMWLFDPANWVRILAGVFGFVFLLAGLAAMSKAV